MSENIVYSMEELKKKKLLTRKEAAFYVGVSPTNMHTIMHSDNFPAFVRIGGRRVFVNREILEQWIDENTGINK